MGLRQSYHPIPLNQEWETPNILPLHMRARILQRSNEIGQMNQTLRKLRQDLNHVEQDKSHYSDQTLANTHENTRWIIHQNIQHIFHDQRTTKILSAHEAQQHINHFYIILDDANSFYTNEYKARGMVLRYDRQTRQTRLNYLSAR